MGERRNVLKVSPGTLYDLLSEKDKLIGLLHENVLYIWKEAS